MLPFLRGRSLPSSFFGPVILLVWRAPLWLLPGVAVLIPALLSSGPGPSYDYRYHHYVLGVPFLVVAAVYGAGAMRQTEGEGGAWRGRIWLAFAVTLLFNSMLVDTPLNPRFFFSDEASGVGLTPSRYLRTPRDALKDEWLQAIPAEAAVMADDTLAERLVNRRLFRRTNMMFSTLEEQIPLMDYVVVDGLYDYIIASAGTWFRGGVALEHETIAALMHNEDFALGRQQDGLLEFNRSSSGLRQEIGTYAYGNAVPVATFGEAIALIGVDLRPAGQHRFLLQFEWIALQPLSGRGPLIAVSQPGTLEHSRILHLPTLALLPTTAWEMDRVVVERFEIKLPEGTPPGDYPLVVGWYDTSIPYAAVTDERSRVGELIHVGSLIVSPP